MLEYFTRAERAKAADVTLALAAAFALENTLLTGKQALRSVPVTRSDQL